MRGVNGYFQIEQKSDNVYVRIFPPIEGGKRVDVEELTMYLENNRISNYNPADFKKVIDLQREEVVFLLTYHLLPHNEEMRVVISEDNMTAKARFYPEYGGGSKMDKKEIISTLGFYGVVAGIQEEAIDEYLGNRQYCTDYIFAKGTQAEQGMDASIKYLFNICKDCKPTLLPDGSVDFFELNNIAHVKKGDLLAVLTEEVQGKPGQNVLGAVIAPHPVKRMKLRYGRNINLSEDGLRLTAMVNGHAELVDDKVFVSDIYQVPADVDVSTGNIEYEGSVEVNGNVLAGHTVMAKGDIIVGGVVEGATLIAGRDIVLKRGIQGMGKGYLEAKNNIVVKFIENAKVKAGGNITTESILHSHVTAGKQVMITGKKGFVTGGYVAATRLVEAKTIGSVMGAETIISVGMDPEKKERYRSLQKNIGELQKNLSQIKPAAIKACQMFSSGVKMTESARQNLQRILQIYKKQTDAIEEHTKEMRELEDYIDIENNARIRVTDRVFPGSKMIISETVYQVKEVTHHCQFRREGADVRVKEL